MTTIYELLDQLRASAISEVDKGRKFERLMKAYLSTDPVYAEQFKHVWLWGDWPGNGGQARHGIDLVAQDRLTGASARSSASSTTRPPRSTSMTSTPSCRSRARSPFVGGSSSRRRTSGSARRAGDRGPADPRLAARPVRPRREPDRLVAVPPSTTAEVMVNRGRSRRARIRSARSTPSSPGSLSTTAAS